LILENFLDDPSHLTRLMRIVIEFYDYKARIPEFNQYQGD